MLEVKEKIIVQLKNACVLNNFCYFLTMRTTFTLLQNKVLPCGSTTIDTAEILNHIATIELPKKERHPSGRRFSVMIDGEHHNFKTVKKLDQFLQCVCSGAACEVFLNFDKCVTVKFRELWEASK